MNRIFRDMMGSDFGGSSYEDKKSDRLHSQKFLQETIMKRCGITESDLEDISIVKSKLRDFNIDEIIK